MSATFDLNKFKYTALASTLILSGVVFKNTYKQLQNPDHILGSTVGPLAFVGGWALLAYSLSMDSQQKFAYTQPWDLRFFACAAAIVASVMMTLKNEKENKPAGMYKYLFIVGWLALGYFMPDQKVGIAAALLVLASMSVVLPWQRTNNVVDGFGMPMFTLAWVMITYINSHSF
jgi:hypothetical protein